MSNRARSENEAEDNLEMAFSRNVMSFQLSVSQPDYTRSLARFLRQVSMQCLPTTFNHPAFCSFHCMLILAVSVSLRFRLVRDNMIINYVAS